MIHCVLALCGLLLVFLPSVIIDRRKEYVVRDKDCYWRPQIGRHLSLRSFCRSNDILTARECGWLSLCRCLSVCLSLCVRVLFVF